MFKKVAAAALLAGCATAAQADVGWITVTGLYDGNMQVDRPDHRLFGRFEGSDADQDGIIRTNELEYFTFNGSYFSNSSGIGGHSTLNFIYNTATGFLDFSAYRYSGDPEHYAYTIYDVQFGSYASIYSAAGERSRHTFWTWTDYTTVTISPVPEPAQVTMLLAGLAGTALVMRRRRR